MMIGDWALHPADAAGDVEEGRTELDTMCAEDHGLTPSIKDAGTPKSAKKKQSSLLAFFSSPSSKRPSEAEAVGDAASSPSPIRRKASGATPLALSSPAYEMLSEEDIDGDGDGPTLKRPTERDPQPQPCVSNMASYYFEEDTTATVCSSPDNGTSPRPVSLTRNPCKWGDAAASACGSLGGEEEVEERAGAGGGARDPNSSHQQQSDEQRYSWLTKIRDGEGRYTDDPDYDPRTLYIPKSQWQKFTPFEKQFWEIKSKLFDTIVFFKKGKFYELYENDADIGAREFDLKMTDRVNMRMVGVPEATFEMWAARFVAAGYKVARVEQTENSIGKSIREKESDAKAEKIIRRELSCILTAGTISEPSMLASDAPSYCMAIKEVSAAAAGPTSMGSDAGEGIVEVGVAIVDSSTGQFMLSSFTDDPSRSTLETLLMQLQPKEMVLERGHLSTRTRQSIKTLLPKILITEAISDLEFWDGPRIVAEIASARYFSGEQAWPKVLRQAHDRACVSFRAFGALLWYLRSLKLDGALLSYCNIARYEPVRAAASMVLDGQTLLNLDVVPSALRSSVSVADPRKGTLLGVIDHCRTAFGRRLMHAWTCNPLRSVEQIRGRQDAVEFFLANPGLAERLGAKLSPLPDLERALSRIHSGSIKIKDFISTVEAFRAIERFKSLLSDQEDSLPSELASALARIPDYREKIEFFAMAFDHKTALQEGQIVPFAGVEADYDRAQGELEAIQERLQAYLREQAKRLGVSSGQARYKDVGKEIFQLELPVDTNVPKEYVLMSKTKNTKRYWTPPIKEMVKAFQEWEERRNSTIIVTSLAVPSSNTYFYYYRIVVLKTLYSKLLKQFSQHSEIWGAVVQAVATLDCQLSLATASALMPEPKCRPQLIESPRAACHMTELRHPCIVTDRLASFIPNDVRLGVATEGGEAGTDERIVLLTGPNMGGKSTLLRQTCLAVIMAQVGCYVPARSCVLSPVDRIFTRLGANDNIIAGQSTFMVELMDTSRILRDAGPRSLVILDELGRGTSTFDGMAIAQATLLYLTRVNRPIGLFATHYRPLAVDLEREPGISCQYMSCALDAHDRKVTFLYKLTRGISPKSYGMNVAAMAGLPMALIEEAEQVAERFDVGFLHSLDAAKAGPNRALTNKLLRLLCTQASQSA